MSTLGYEDVFKNLARGLLLRKQSDPSGLVARGRGRFLRPFPLTRFLNEIPRRHSLCNKKQS